MKEKLIELFRHRKPEPQSDEPEFYADEVMKIFASHPGVPITEEETKTLEQMTDEEAITIAQYVLGYGEWMSPRVHRFGGDKIAVIDEFQNPVKHIDDYNKDRDNWNWVEIDKNLIIHHRTHNVLYSTREAYLYLIEEGYIGFPKWAIQHQGGESEWISVEDRLPDGHSELRQNELEVLGYNEEWINLDFNPLGIRVCVYCEAYDNQWMSCRWNNTHDTFIVDEESSPTHWKPHPLAPSQ